MKADASRLERLDRADWRLLAVCAIVLVASLTFSLSFFDRAFPEASIDFRYGRGSSEPLALDLLTKVGLTPEDRTHAAKFEVDDAAKIFLERSLGLKQANELMGDEVEVWTWTHRWFRPLETEEMLVRISPRGEVVGFQHRIEETQPATPVEPELREPIARRFLQSIGVDTSELELVSISDKSLPNRVDSILVWEHRTVRPRDAAYRYEVTLHGAVVGGFEQSLQVPEEWRREYASLRAKNETASDAASILLLVTTIAALFIYVVRVRRRDVQMRYSGWVGGICAILVTLVSLNAIPSALADYDTKTSFSSFLLQEIGFALLGGISLGLFLMVMVGAGDALFRERLPDKLAMPRLFSKKGFRSKRVFTGGVIGFTLVGGFLAYQVAFYLIAERFGAWAPAEIPYDDTLNTLLPWAVVLFGGFFPAFSEEYISRAFSIPFLERLLRWRFPAIVISAMIWGFGHSAYPNQPFFIRGLEVGFAGIVLGYIVYRFGLLPALVWHYTVDAIYTALLLMQSGNTYYVISSAICAFIFFFPLILSGVFYVRHGGFEPDSDLENRAIGTSSPDEAVETEEVSDLPPEPGRPKRPLVIGAVAAVAALILWSILPEKLDAIADYPVEAETAIGIATDHLGFDERTRPEKVVAYPSAGFRNWNDDDTTGGSPGTYDSVAAEHIAREARNPFALLRRIMTEDVEAATWKVRFFTPGVTEEFTVEVDSRTGRVVGETHTVEEDAPGATLERDSASEIAVAAMRRFGLEPDSFEIREAIAVPMPDRRDWVFHFERREPIAIDTWMRVIVRLEGNRIAHVGKTVRIPETVRRHSGENRLVNSLLFFGQILGAILLLVVVGAASVISLREKSLRWKPALRATALLAVPAAIAGMLPMALAARDYRTSISWDTFVGRQMLFTAESVAFQLFLMFLSLVVIAACQPWAMDLLTRGRSRFGRDAVIRGLVGAAIFYAIFLLGDALELWSRVGLDVFSPVSNRNAIPFPALAVLWRALSTAAWVAALSVAGRAFVDSLDSVRRKRVTEIVIVLALAVFLADSSALTADLPVVILDSILTSLLLWLVARYVFAPNPLSVLLAVLVFTSADDISSWLRSGRSDLEINALILAVIIVATFAWLLSGKATSTDVEQQTSGSGPRGTAA